MINFLGVEFRIKVFYPIVFASNFAVYFLFFLKVDFAYIFVDGFNPTAENILSLIALTNMALSATTLALYFTGAKLSPAIHSFFVSFLLVNSFFTIALFILTVVAIFCYSAGKSPFAIFWILFEGICLLMALVFLIFMDWKLKKAFGNPADFVYQLSEEEQEINTQRVGFEMTDR